MKPVPERVLRAIAWGVCGFLVAMLIAAMLIYVTAPPQNAPSWGGDGGLAGEVAFAAIALLFTVTGVLILRRHPRNTIGWVVMGVASLWGLGLLADNYSTYGCWWLPVRCLGRTWRQH